MVSDTSSLFHFVWNAQLHHLRVHSLASYTRIHSLLVCSSLLFNFTSSYVLSSLTYFSTGLTVRNFDLAWLCHPSFTSYHSSLTHLSSQLHYLGFCGQFVGISRDKFIEFFWHHDARLYRHHFIPFCHITSHYLFDRRCCSNKAKIYQWCFDWINE